ncbi:MAG: hypothetical protein JO043_04110 [Candidatus Eremiobacteraeota bacterium]|nr:hypothetical protein [Candidatus Eremiobacteraeota bacterium]
MKTLGPWLVLGTILGGTAAFAQSGEGCTHDRLHVGSTPVDVMLCVAAGEKPRQHRGGAVDVGVVETFSANGTSFSRNVPLEFMDDSESTRTMDDVSLRQLAIDRTLHLTMRYGAGTVHLEHALLLPDAIRLK